MLSSHPTWLTSKWILCSVWFMRALSKPVFKHCNFCFSVSGSVRVGKNLNTDTATLFASETSQFYKDSVIRFHI